MRLLRIQMLRLTLIFIIGLNAILFGQKDSDICITVGSKKFTESVILGEIVAQLAQDAGIVAVHRRQLGGTRVLWNGLLKGEIDIYPEYTGTILREILNPFDLYSEQDLREKLAEFGIKISPSLGFNNTYAIGMKTSLTDKFVISKISDLRKHPDL